MGKRRAATKKKFARQHAPESVTHSEREAGPLGGNKSSPVVGIGASAEGLEAFTFLLQHLSADTGMCFVLVQHLDPVHESALTKLLSKATSMRVHEVTDNLLVEADHVYVIPPNSTLSEGVQSTHPYRR